MKVHAAFTDPKLIGASFDPLSSWAGHVALLKALEDPQALDEGFERDLVMECTGRELWREDFRRAREALLLVGRRGGKSRTAAAISVALAVLREWPNLAPGEQGVIAVVAASQNQAKHLLRMVRGIVDSSPLIRARVSRETATAIEFGATRIEVMPCSYRTVRGHTFVAVICDELAHWFDSETSSNPASEFIRSVRPALASSEGLLVCITTPWSRAGVVWEMFDEHYEKPGDVLCWRAPSTLMNKAEWLRAEVARERLRDPVNAATEYDCDFRTDIEAFLSRDALAPCIVPGRGTLPRDSDQRYVCYADSSGGIGDSYALSVAHAECRESGEQRVICDLIVERRPPFDPRQVTLELAEIARNYGVTEIHSDRYAAGFNSGAWKDAGFQFKPSEHTASELYRSALPMFLSQMAELPDDDRLVSQLVSLERRVSRSGREVISHPRNGHDDRCNAVCGALVTAATKPRGLHPADIYGENGIHAVN